MLVASAWYEARSSPSDVDVVVAAATAASAPARDWAFGFDAPDPARLTETGRWL